MNQPQSRRRRRREPLLPPRGVAIALAIAFVSIAVLVLVRPKHSSNHAAATGDTTTTTGVAPTTTIPTTTTTDPGVLPQTGEKPVASDPAQQARAKVLFDAILADDPAAALPAFFPESAYVQIKALANPAADYQNRLIAQFTADIHTLHTKLAPASWKAAVPVFNGLDVVGTPVWVKPGVESNKGSYWRVYDSQLRYTLAGVPKSLTIKSLISWRGQWYVVHLIAIR